MAKAEVSLDLSQAVVELGVVMQRAQRAEKAIVRQVGDAGEEIRDLARSVAKLAETLSALVQLEQGRPNGMKGYLVLWDDLARSYGLERLAGESDWSLAARIASAQHAFLTAGPSAVLPATESSAERPLSAAP